MENVKFSKIKPVLFLIAIFAILVISLFGCAVPGTDDESPSQSSEQTYEHPAGSFVSSWDAFLIDETVSPNMFYYYGDIALKGTAAAFEGEITDVVASETAGYFVVKVTDSSSDYYHPTFMYTGSYAYFEVGNYTIIKYKEYDGSACQESTPYKDGVGGDPESFDTVAAAINTLVTDASADDYYAAYGSYTKE